MTEGMANNISAEIQARAVARAAATAGPPVDLDGTMGEGGGQVLRSSLALSVITGRPLRIDRIRGGRPRPGLMRQHLTAVRAAATICGGAIAGDELRSPALGFRPGPIVGGEWTFDIGSAGSTSLVLQTILVPLMFADAPSRVTIIGGTHNPFAPTSDFIELVWLPLLMRMGAKLRFTRERHGFMPSGGGRIVVDVTPIPGLEPIELFEAGEVLQREAVVLSAGIAGSVATRELARVRERTGWPAEHGRRERAETMAGGSGNALALIVRSEHVTEVFTALGRRGRSAEDVADSAVEDYRQYVATGAPVGPHLADQLLLPLAVAGGGAFRTGPLTEHSRTNMAVIERFLDVRFEVDAPVDSSVHEVRVTAGQ